MLPAKPVFFRAGDFREGRGGAWWRALRARRATLGVAPPPPDDGELPDGRLQLIADGEGRLAVSGCNAPAMRCRWHDLLQSVASVPPARLADLPAELAALHTCD